MTGRMESVENLSEQRGEFAVQRQVFHPPHRPLEIAGLPTFPQPGRRISYKPTNNKTKGDTSTGPEKRTFLLGLSIFQSKNEPEDGGWGFLRSWSSFLVFW